MKHEVKIVRLGNIEPHPDADSLGLTVVDGFNVVVKLDQWREGDLAVYIEPDYVVPAAPWSAFLGAEERHRRIRVKKLRGIYSQGLLLPLSTFPELSGWGEGDDVMEKLGIVRYEPPEPGEPQTSGGRRMVNPGEPPHPLLAKLAKYDLESAQKYAHLVFLPEDEVVVTEKLHGENARYAWIEGRMWVGSRNRWVPQEEGGGHWQTLQDNPWIEEWCRDNPEHVLFGESYGNFPGMRYGAPTGKRGFRAFDVFDLHLGFWPSKLFWEHRAIKEKVPFLCKGLFKDCDLAEIAEGRSTLADHVREGCVVKPWVEHPRQFRHGRPALKYVGNGFYEREGKR